MFYLKCEGSQSPSSFLWIVIITIINLEQRQSAMASQHSLRIHGETCTFKTSLLASAKSDSKEESTSDSCNIVLGLECNKKGICECTNGTFWDNDGCKIPEGNYCNAGAFTNIERRCVDGAVCESKSAETMKYGKLEKGRVLEKSSSTCVCKAFRCARAGAGKSPNFNLKQTGFTMSIMYLAGAVTVTVTIIQSLI